MCCVPQSHAQRGHNNSSYRWIVACWWFIFCDFACSFLARAGLFALGLFSVCIFCWLHWRNQLCGTGARAPWSLCMYTNLAVSIYLSLVGSGNRLVLNSTHFPHAACCCIPSHFTFPVYYIYVCVCVISTWFREHTPWRTPCPSSWWRHCLVVVGLTVSATDRLEKLSPKWCTMCRVGRLTLLTLSLCFYA